MDPAVHQKQGLFNPLQGGEQRAGSERDHAISMLYSKATFYRKIRRGLEVGGMKCEARNSRTWWRAGSAARPDRPPASAILSSGIRTLRLSCLRPSRFRTISSFDLVGAWLSLVEHLVRDQGVGGSNPLAPTNTNQNAWPIQARFWLEWGTEQFSPLCNEGRVEFQSGRRENAKKQRETWSTNSPTQAKTGLEWATRQIKSVGHECPTHTALS